MLSYPGDLPNLPAAPVGRRRSAASEELLHPPACLKKRSSFINITLEDITRLTDRFETIYSMDADPQALRPPANSALIGR
jgi:hypothetical protein